MKQIMRLAVALAGVALADVPFFYLQPPDTLAGVGGTAFRQSLWDPHWTICRSVVYAVFVGLGSGPSRALMSAFKRAL